MSVNLWNQLLLVSPSQDSSLWLAAKLGNLDEIQKGIQGDINVNAKDEVCQYNYSNISVVYN